MQQLMDAKTEERVLEGRWFPLSQDQKCLWGSTTQIGIKRVHFSSLYIIKWETFPFTDTWHSNKKRSLGHNVQIKFPSSKFPWLTFLIILYFVSTVLTNGYSFLCSCFTHRFLNCFMFFSLKLLILFPKQDYSVHDDLTC